jgi:hypothetical protein
MGPDYSRHGYLDCNWPFQLQEFGVTPLPETMLTNAEIEQLLSKRPPVRDCSRLPGSSICYSQVSAYEWHLQFKPLTVNQVLHGEDASQAVPPEPKAERPTQTSSFLTKKQRKQLLAKKLKRKS